MHHYFLCCEPFLFETMSRHSVLSSISLSLFDVNHVFTSEMQSCMLRTEVSVWSVVAIKYFSASIHSQSFQLPGSAFQTPAGTQTQWSQSSNTLLVFIYVGQRGWSVFRWHPQTPGKISHVLWPTVQRETNPSFASLFLRVSARYIFTPHFKSIVSLNMKVTIRGCLWFAYNNRLTSLQCRGTGSAWVRGHTG